MYFGRPHFKREESRDKDLEVLTELLETLQGESGDIPKRQLILESELGRGTFGVVYRTHDRTIDISGSAIKRGPHMPLQVQHAASCEFTFVRSWTPPNHKSTCPQPPKAKAETYTCSCFAYGF